MVSSFANVESLSHALCCYANFALCLSSNLRGYIQIVLIFRFGAEIHLPTKLLPL